MATFVSEVQHGEPEDEDRMKERENAAALVCWEEARELVTGCSCVVGMHPDQASEAIVQVMWRVGGLQPMPPSCTVARSPRD